MSKPQKYYFTYEVTKRWRSSDISTDEQFAFTVTDTEARQAEYKVKQFCKNEWGETHYTYRFKLILIEEK